jgi:hypothetical protein
MGCAEAPKRVKKSVKKSTFYFEFCSFCHISANYLPSLIPSPLIGSTHMHATQITFLDINQAVLPLFSPKKQSHVVTLSSLESLSQLVKKMYYTVTRLNASAIQNVIRLSPAIPVTPFHWINNEAELQQMNRTWIRFVDADGWALLGAHQELSLEGTYEYIITLLIQQHYRGLSIVQLHSERPLPDLIVALGNQLTEATSFPCVYYYGLMIHLGSETMGPLRDFIRSLPREIYRL